MWALLQVSLSQSHIVDSWACTEAADVAHSASCCATRGHARHWRSDVLRRAQLMLQKRPHIVCEEADGAVAGTLRRVLTASYVAHRPSLPQLERQPVHV